MKSLVSDIPGGTGKTKTFFTVYVTPTVRAVVLKKDLRFCQISCFRKNSNLPRLEPEADMKQNGTWKKLETEANQVNLKPRPIMVSSMRPICYTKDAN
jgi:hypothetical protein